MCIGIPMQVTAVEPGHAVCVGRGETRRVRTALVDTVQAGDWLLIFIDSAQEHITAQRAREVNGTLDLLAAVMQGDLSGMRAHSDAAFALPSSMSHEQLLALSSGAP